MSNPAETYESYMVPALFLPWAQELVRVARPQPGERALDLACGTGVIARQVAPRVTAKGKVTGLDLNPNMLVVARAAAAREGFGIEWHEGQAEKLPFPDCSFDLVLCQAALMFFADRRAALAEMHRVLTDGGRAVLSVLQGLERHPFYMALHETIHKRFGMSGVSDIFAMGGADDLRSLLATAGFQRVEIEPVALTARFPDPGRFLAMEIEIDTAAIPSMQHLDDKARLEVVGAIRDDMESMLREHTQGDYVVMPFETHIGRGERRRPT